MFGRRMNWAGRNKCSRVQTNRQSTASPGWAKDRVNKNQFKVHWDAGKNNIADYAARHHSGKHHKQWRPTMLNADGKSPETLQGCVEIMTAD